jgi:hypothetical protein
MKFQTGFSRRRRAEIRNAIVAECAGIADYRQKQV